MDCLLIQRKLSHNENITFISAHISYRLSICFLLIIKYHQSYTACSYNVVIVISGQTHAGKCSYGNGLRLSNNLIR